jgi:hypothetical protein
VLHPLKPVSCVATKTLDLQFFVHIACRKAIVGLVHCSQSEGKEEKKIVGEGGEVIIPFHSEMWKSNDSGR